MVQTGKAKPASNSEEAKWFDRVRWFLKVQARSKRLTNGALAKLMTESGYPETSVSIQSKLSRGTFSAAFFFECLQVMRVKAFSLDDLSDLDIDHDLYEPPLDHEGRI